MTLVNIFIAFLGGLISFLAPCALPLLPAFICYISGVSYSQLTKGNSSFKFKKKILESSLLYISGFSLAFVLLGLSATALSKTLISNRELLSRIGGLFIILFGAFMLGLFNRFHFLQTDLKINLPVSLQRVKFLGPFLLGVTFALAWTPCAGAVLGAILTLAASSGSLMEGATLLFFYSLGIAMPFLLVALLYSKCYRYIGKMGVISYFVNLFGGVLLIYIGLMLFLGKFTLINSFFYNLLYQLPIYKKFTGFL